MDRQEWSSYKHENNGYVSTELWRIVRDACDQCSITNTLMVTGFGGGWAAIEGLRNYNYITFGLADESRISAFPASFFYNMVWDTFVDPTIESDARLISVLRSYWNDEPSSGKRMEKAFFIKIGKFLTAMGLDGADSCLCANIAERLRLRAKVDLSVIKVTGQVSSIYNTTHAPSGSIGSSCMRSSNQDRFQIYEDIGCQIAYILDENNRLAGRALLHENVHRGDETFKLMDRIYFDCEKTKAIFYSWARENGYTRKERQELNCDSYIRPGGSCFEDSALYIETGSSLLGKYEEVPYIDTFAHYNDKEQRLYNYSADGVITCMKETDGNDSEGVIAIRAGETCCCCGERDREYGRRHDDEFYCEECFNGRFIRCECCGDYSSNDCTYNVGGGYVCEYCFDRNYFTCDACGDNHERSEYNETQDGDVICRGCYENNYFTCDDCGEICHINDSRSTADGDDICRGCYENNYFTCGGCGEIHNDSDGVDGKSICISCHESMEVEA